jgi:hypothetical protein
MKKWGRETENDNNIKCIFAEWCARRAYNRVNNIKPLRSPTRYFQLMARKASFGWLPHLFPPPFGGGRMSGKINVVFEDGTLHFLKVTENLNYNHDAGAYCKMVEYEGREILVKRPQGMKLWRPHTARERVQPLVDYLERKAKQRRHP